MKIMYKKNKNIIGIALVLMITGLLFQSCTKDHLEINQDPYGITDDQLTIDYKLVGEPFKQAQINI